MLERAVSGVVHVTSVSKRREPPIQVPVPEVGRRWGAAADFGQVSDRVNEEQASINFRFLKPPPNISGHEIAREYDVEQITSTKGQVFEVENIKSVTFQYDYKEFRFWEKQPDRSWPRGAVETWGEVLEKTYYYIKITFPSLRGSSLRGEARPPTPKEENLPERLDKIYGR